MKVELNYKALTALVQALDTQLGAMETRIAATKDDDESADLRNDLGYLKALRQDLAHKAKKAAKG